jgi:transcriptional regulator with XRE-family HTH domain
MALAAKLKNLRIRKGKSLNELAMEVGASKAHIWDLETGRAKNPTIDLLTKLASALGTSISELVGENPGGKEEPAEVLTMYRELKALEPEDLETIRIMMERLKKRSE